MTDYEKLESIIDEIDILVDAKVTKSSPEFKAWFTDAERFLSKKYGKDSLELTSFQHTHFSPGLYVSGMDLSKYCKDGLIATKLTFEKYSQELEEKFPTSNENSQNNNYDKIFIVHGHNGELKASVARIIEKQGIEAIILSEKANQGRTIIEKFEDYSDVSGAICLFTADDIGKEKTESDLKSRARQNVVFETGYFMGKLGRNNIVILADKDVEMPSDLQGVLYTTKSNWQIDLIKELKAMGYTVDLEKLID